MVVLVCLGGATVRSQSPIRVIQAPRLEGSEHQVLRDYAHTWGSHKGTSGNSVFRNVQGNFSL